MVMVVPDHPLAAHKSLRLSDLKPYPLCLAPKHFRVRNIMETAEAQQHVFLEATMTTNSILAMRDAAKSGDYAVILPLIGAADEVRDGTLVAIPLVEEKLEATSVALVTRVGRQLEGAPLRLLSAIESRVKDWTESHLARGD
jgi:DNA-binding transcriptional LysR family regulator